MYPNLYMCTQDISNIWKHLFPKYFKGLENILTYEGQIIGYGIK